MRVDNTSFYFAGHERVAQENKLAKESISKLAERPVSVSISKEGYESYRNSIQENGKALSYDQVAEQRKMLAVVKMDSDTDFGYRLSLEANQLNEKDKTSANGGFSWQARVENYAEAYANLYDEIVQGYTDGTRKINVMDKNSELGYRTLTMEEELNALDAAYEKTVKGFEESAKQQQKAQGIIKEWSEDIKKIKSGGSSVAPVSSQKDQVNVDDDHLATAEQWIQDYTENIDPTLGYRSRDTLAGTYQGLIDMFTIVGGALCAMLALIGVLNFINSMVTSVLTRWGEIAMLQSVGMTGSQVQKMLVFEGLGYAVLGIVSSLILAAFINVTALRSITTGMDYFTYRFTLTPALLCSIPLLAVTALVPWLCYRKMARVSIVERLRTEE